MRQIRQWLATSLSMLLLITGLLPAGVALAAETINFDASTAVPVASSGDGTSQSKAYVVSSQTISGLKVAFSGTTELSPQIRITLNGDPLQTLPDTTDPVNPSYTIKNFNLSPGANVLMAQIVSTGNKAYIYYQYNPTEDNRPIILDGYQNQGIDPYNAVVFGDSKITLSGTYGAGLTGSNLRIKIITNNGQTVNDLEKTPPKLGTNNRFTFSDIPLSAGLNQIVFYEKLGNTTAEHLNFYVQYNNTPLLSNLTIEDTPLEPIDTTFITVDSADNMELRVSGKATNADTVEIRNKTTGEAVEATVSRTGLFSADLPARLGENILAFTAINNNKKVGEIDRTIFILTSEDDEDSLFYDVSLGSIALNPDKSVNLYNDVTSFDFVGYAAIKFDETRNTNLKFEVKVEDTTNASATPITFEISGSELTKEGTTQDGFNRYKLNKPAAVSSSSLTEDHTYRVSLSYSYDEVDSSGGHSPAGSTSMNNYKYLFTYVDKDKPLFGNVEYLSSALSTTENNVISTVPAKFKVYTQNMALDESNFTIRYNNDVMSDIDFNSFSTADGQGFEFTLKSLGSGEGVLKISYENGGESADTPEYHLEVNVSPFVQLTYVDSSGKVRSFEDGFVVNDIDDIPNLDGKVYNTTISTLEAELNGEPLAITSQQTDTFRILDDKISDGLKKGTNKLEIVLNKKYTFTYDILFITSQAPTITGVKLKVNANGKNVDLEKDAGDSEYKTGAEFLTDFTFEVNDATHVYVEKNGNRIIDFVNDDGDWKADRKNYEYLDTLDQLPDDDDITDYFEEYNFESSGKNDFEGEMSTTQYNKILKSVQDKVTDPDDQEEALNLFPLILEKNGKTIYTIVAEDDNGARVRYEITINQQTNSWEIISPTKIRDSDEYIIVNSNSIPIKIFAENADKVMFGKVEATVENTTNRDFTFDEDLGKAVPKTYYVFTANVSLKKGLNTVKFTVQVGNNSYNDQVEIYNANSSVSGAEYRDTLGKKVSFSLFDKGLTLKFPTGTVLMSPDDNEAGKKVDNPNARIYTDVPLYFGIADKTTGQVTIPGDDLADDLELDNDTLLEKFNYASPLYYIDGGYEDNPGGKDPYDDEGDTDDFKSRYDENLVPNKEGTLTIAYDTSVVNAANNVLSVFFFDGRDWHSLGGVVNTGNQTITVPFRAFGYYIVLKNKESFDDVVNHDYARDDMETLYSKGIMSAYSGSSFGANLDISRGEFATMLVKALDLPINDGPYDGDDPVSPTFSDVKPDWDTWDYEYKYIETAARAGIVRGTEPGFFEPDEPLLRQEAAIMIARAMNLKTTGTPEAAQANLEKLFTDGKDVGYYAAQSVLAVTKAKLMTGEPVDANAKKPTYRFLPESKLTRADMAVITVRVMKQLKKL